MISISLSIITVAVRLSTSIKFNAMATRFEMKHSAWTNVCYARRWRIEGKLATCYAEAKSASS